MATAPPPTTRPRQGRREAPAPAPRWRRWLLLGMCFGLGYGLTQRLLAVRWGEGSPRAPEFRPKSTPSGTSLEDLRRQKGEEARPLAADLEQLGNREREEKAKLEAERKGEIERQNAEIDQEKERLEADRRRLEELHGGSAPSSPNPSPPAIPELPPPDPLSLEQRTPTPAQGPGAPPPPVP